MFELTIDGNIKTYDTPVALADIMPEKVYAAKVNNRIRELSYIINHDAKIEFLGLNNADAVRIYESTLRFILLMALNNLAPYAKVRITYGISMSLFIEIEENVIINEQLVEAIKQEMKNIIDANYEIKRRDVTIKDILQYYEENGLEDKKNTLKYRPDSTAHVYSCNGYMNYMFGYMLPKTGFIKSFNLIPYYPGIVLQYPRCECGGAIPPFNPEPKYAQTLQAAQKWSKTVECDNIADLNETVQNGNIVDFINICEAKHSRMLSHIGEDIEKNKENIRLIAIAGPSSSGKTTFSNRVKIELLSRGIKPIMISMDNYYKPRKDTPLDDKGKPDFEHIEALDISLFNRDILTLIQGGEIIQPVFNFKTGEREIGKITKLRKDNILIIEGIHALNERLTSLIPRNQKYKIYIAPQQQINIDNHNPIRLTDIRLLRRIVRDHRYRNTPVINTLEMWGSVRKGEFRWIYQFQEDADFIFNSELSYEMGVLKKYALPLLQDVDQESKHYITANRLIKFLKYFVDIDDSFVPCNSLLREFIGGSCFNV